jgi:excinuclease ABC subunit C
VVAGPEGFRKNQYRKFNIKSETLTPGDDYAMMREVLTRRFKRLISEAPRAADTAADAGSDDSSERAVPHDDASQSPWPDLVLIDGGEGQLTAARQVFAELSIDNVPLVAISKGPDRDAGRETFHMPGRASFKLPARDPVLYFVQRLRDEVHRFAIGSHRQKRRKDIREAGLQEINGIGPGRKRALLRHFGTLKAIERASVADLSHVPGINAETARRIYDFFHEQR